MQRRHFLRAAAAAAVAGIAPFAASAQAAAEAGAGPGPHKFKLKYAPHFGMFEASAGKDLLNQLRFMADAGFTALEDNNLMKRPASLQAQIGEALTRLGMTMGVFVIDAGDNWKRVEEYFSDIDFSHSYCPDCYYEHSLRPELQRLLADPHWSARLPVPDGNATLDPRVLQALSEFEAAESPDLVHDLVDSFVESSDVLRQDLYGFGASGLLGGEGLERVQRFATRCTDLGLGRLAGVLHRIATLKPEEQLSDYVELANAAAAELDVALSALGEAREGQPTGR